MKRLIACIIIFSIQLELISQNIGCELIFKSIQSEVFQKEFSICKDTLSFTIYDKTNKIVTCRNFELCNKTLKISNDSCYKDITFEKKHPKKKDTTLLILWDYKQKGSEYSLIYWRPYTGATVNLIFRKKKNKYKLIKSNFGSI